MELHLPRHGVPQLTSRRIPVLHPAGYNPGAAVADTLDAHGTRAVRRHNDTYNIAFADGHVKSMPTTQYRHWSYWAD